MRFPVLSSPDQRLTVRTVYTMEIMDISSPMSEIFADSAFFLRNEVNPAIPHIADAYDAQP